MSPTSSKNSFQQLSIKVENLLLEWLLESDKKSVISNNPNEDGRCQLKIVVIQNSGDVPPFPVFAPLLSLLFDCAMFQKNWFF